ncbi:MAG: DinB family protein [Flavihumibacter sp.]
MTSSAYQLVYADFYASYVQLAASDDLIKTLKKNRKKLLSLLAAIPSSKINYAYAAGKWTVKQMLQHMIDAERVFAYRALRIARFDTTPLPGFDENAWAEKADVTARGWNDMIKEFSELRKSNIRMISQFNKEQLAAEGTASGQTVSAAALCFVMAGHVKHHMNILQERYL